MALDTGVSVLWPFERPDAPKKKFGYTVRKIVLKLLLYLYFRTKVLKFRHDILIR